MQSPTSIHKSLPHLHFFQDKPSDPSPHCLVPAYCFIKILSLSDPLDDDQLYLFSIIYDETASISVFRLWYPVVVTLRKPVFIAPLSEKCSKNKLILYRFYQTYIEFHAYPVGT